MNLRSKTLIVVAVGFVFIIGIFIGYAALFLESQYKYLEQEEITGVTREYYTDIGSELQSMDRLLKSYSGWNDTYEFVLNPTEKYIDLNFYPESLSMYGVDGIIILNLSGGPVFTLMKDPITGNIRTFPSAVLENLSSITTKYQILSGTSGVFGISTLGGYDALIASEPILTDSYEGPARGSMHYVTWLTPEYLNSFTHEKSNLVRYSRTPAPVSSEYHTGFTGTSEEIPDLQISPKNTSTIEGSFIVSDLLQNGQYTFIIPHSRLIYTNGIQTIITNIFLLIFSGFVVSIIVLYFIDTTLLSRIDSIVRKLKESGESNGNSAIKANNGDELDVLVQALDPFFVRYTQSQDALKQHEDFYQRVADTIRDGLMIFEEDDSGQNLVYCNPRALEITGGSCTYTNIKEFLDTAVSEEHQRVCEEWEQSHRLHTYDTTIRFWMKNSAGERRYIIARFSLIPSQTESRRILVVISDITEMKKTEELIRESEAKYRFMTENIQDVHWQLTPALNFTYISPADELLRGFQADEVIGKKLWDFIPVYGIPEVKKVTDAQYEIQNGASRLDVTTFETELLCKDGRIISSEFVSNPIYNTEGDLIGFHGIYRDITERKIAEEAIRQANKKLNLLASITRHDVLNQMTVIISTIELVKEEDIAPFIRSLMDTAQKAADIVIRLIQFARDYQDIGIAAPRWFSVTELFSEAETSFKNPELSVQIKTKALSLFADALLEKVFFNLIDNSIRHGNSVTRISIEGWKGDDGYHLIYSDDGEGIPESERDKIFVRGYGKNTGMGLFLIREILSITGITIEENGKPGDGARFEMIIPEGRYRV